MSVSADRATAARILVRVEGGAFAARLLERSGRPGVRARVLGVLRWRRLLDEVIRRFTRRPPEKFDPEVRAVLRLGLFEAVEMGVPTPVAVDAAVRLVRRIGKTSAAGLVNAILRRAAAAWDAVINDVPPDLRLSHPAWLYRRWRTHFGEDAAEKIMAVDQTPAGLWIWLAGDGQAGAELGGRLEPHPWCPGAFRVPGDAPGVIRAVRQGVAYAQDPSSQLVAHVAAALAEEMENARLADLCAAPGGKVALAAGLGTWERVAAVELHTGRARLMAENLARLGRTVPVVVGDAGQSPLSPGEWDLVILDAPCSGTGTLRRHPDLKWRLAEEKIGELARKQARMIDGALRLLRAGGILLYTTCSIEPEENEMLIAHVEGPFETVPLMPRMPSGVTALGTEAGGVRLLPAPGADGFTFHALRYNPVP